MSYSFMPVGVSTSLLLATEVTFGGPEASSNSILSSSLQPQGHLLHPRRIMSLPQSHTATFKAAVHDHHLDIQHFSQA